MNTDSDRPEQHIERRGAQRFEAHQPLAVHFEGRTVPGFIQDLSGRGMFFYVETVLAEGAIVELTFTMPSEITLGESMPVRCRGRVLRSSSPAGGQTSTQTQDPTGQRSGIAVQLDSYQYLPSDETAAQFVRVSGANSAGSASRPAAR